jgi:hypothetical protein
MSFDRIYEQALRCHACAGMCTGSRPLSMGIAIDIEGNPIIKEALYFESNEGTFKRVKND